MDGVEKQPCESKSSILASEIVKSYLEEHGYDGLFTEGCGCRLENGLCPCAEPGWASCWAGFCAEAFDPEEGEVFVWGKTKEDLEQQIDCLIRDGGRLL